MPLEQMHLHALRPARRRKVPNGTTGADTIGEVRTLCGKWVQKPYATRHDRARSAVVATCDACKAIVR